ncbi:hypothetical protein PRNP1_008624 [Phytophthora ramorum]
MGARASRDAGAGAAGTEGPMGQQDERLAARTWRTGEPFTLLHDEGFVVEKYNEILAASSVQTTPSKALEEAQTTVSGMDEAPMDEMQHATDMARVKLFARTLREEGATGDQNGSQPASPSATGAIASTLISSTSKENPPSALAGMLGNTLSRESPESLDNEKLRAQRDELLQVYFEQIAARMKLHQASSSEEETLEEGFGAVARDLTASELPDDDGMPSSLGVTLPCGPVVGERCKISEGVTAASIFSVGSLRMQLEMLREFRVFSPRLFENGTMALVQTLLDSPPFVLQEVVTGSPEDALLSDVHRFCRDILYPEDGGQVTSQVQRQIALLLLLSVGENPRIYVFLTMERFLRFPWHVQITALTM